MKRIILLFSMLILIFAHTGYAQLKIKYEKYTLPNGLTVILHEDHTLPIISCNLWYHVGSGNEKPGRTGFAHLFEHLMFEGSKNVPEGKFDEWLEAAGGDNNASTSADRTNYYIDAPSNALELALFLDSDRMGFLTDAMSARVVDGQRDVVKNERRQSYENRPYGMASIAIDENLFPEEHPYHWPTIGSQEDLSAASYDDVVRFFKKYYVPNNTSLVIAGDIDPVRTRDLVEKWFGEIGAGDPVPPINAPPAYLTSEKRIVLEDKVQLPRLYINWITPKQFTPGDAELDILSNILAGGKNSRLYKRLVYDLQIAQDVNAHQASGAIVSTFAIITTARAGRTLTELEDIIREEIRKIQQEAPRDREVQRAVNQYESGFLNRIERIGGFGGKADLLNAYYFATGNPDYFNEDFARYKALTPEDIQAAAQKYLQEDPNVVLSVVPAGKKDLAASKRGGK